MAYTGLYAADGSQNIEVVSGATYTGRYSANGALNVVIASGGSYLGATHPCGAAYITNTPAPGNSGAHRRSPNGSMNCSVSPYTNGGQKVTVVSGVFP